MTKTKIKKMCQIEVITSSISKASSQLRNLNPTDFQEALCSFFPRIGKYEFSKLPKISE